MLVALIEPMRQRRLQYEQAMDHVTAILQTGTIKANQVANETLLKAKEMMQQRYFLMNQDTQDDLKPL